MVKVTWQAWMRQCLNPGQWCSRVQIRIDLCQRCTEGVTLNMTPFAAIDATAIERSVDTGTGQEGIDYYNVCRQLTQNKNPVPLL